MTAAPRWRCELCAATRVTRRGIESHVRARHPERYREAMENIWIPLFHHIADD